MTHSDDDEPLDPAVEAIRVKMVRLLMVSGGIMMLGLMAVLAAIVYKITSSQPSGDVVPVASQATISLPAGHAVRATSVTRDGMFLTVELANGSTEIRRYNLKGQLISTFSIIEE